jgi:hypothetical protein
MTKAITLNFTEEDYKLLHNMYAYASEHSVANEATLEEYLQRVMIEAATGASSLRGKTFTCI